MPLPFFKHLPRPMFIRPIRDVLIPELIQDHAARIGAVSCHAVHNDWRILCHTLKCER